MNKPFRTQLDFRWDGAVFLFREHKLNGKFFQFLVVSEISSVHESERVFLFIRNRFGTQKPDRKTR